VGAALLLADRLGDSCCCCVFAERTPASPQSALDLRKARRLSTSAELVGMRCLTLAQLSPPCRNRHLDHSILWVAAKAGREWGTSHIQRTWPSLRHGPQSGPGLQATVDHRVRGPCYWRSQRWSPQNLVRSLSFVSGMGYAVPGRRARPWPDAFGWAAARSALLMASDWVITGCGAFWQMSKQGLDAALERLPATALDEFRPPALGAASWFGVLQAPPSASVEGGRFCVAPAGPS